MAENLVHELRLKTTPHDSRVLNKRLELARQIYNACLGEGFRKLALVRASKMYQQAKSLPVKEKNKNGELIYNKARLLLFKEANAKYKFSDYALQDYALLLRKSNYLSKHIDSLTAQKLAKRAYDSIYQYVIGLRGRPRFKGKNSLSSIEGKNNASGIRYKKDKIIWSGLELVPIFDSKDKHQLEAYTLSLKTKYVRLIRRTIKNEQLWFAQLIQAGKPFIKIKNSSPKDIVGLDIGPSTIAIVGSNQAVLQEFCPEVVEYDDKIRTNKRKIARSLRATNPDNYEPTKFVKSQNGKSQKKLGKTKTKANTWVKSKKCQRLMATNKELYRVMATARNTSQGKLANKILRLGKVVKTEKLSYKGMQKLFGRSIGKRAPSTLIAKIRYKAENAGGELYEFSTYKTALSQTCICGDKQKKPLKQRWHKCLICNIEVQRDLFSANLARFVTNDSLDISEAQSAWAGVGTLLEQAISELNKTANGGSKKLASFGLNQRQSCSLVKEESTISDALDVVCIRREPMRANSLVLRTP